MWRDHEEDAILIGLDLHYYWSLTPKQWEKYVKVFSEERIRINKEKDQFNYMLGKYIAWAFNDPKHYPNKPFLETYEESTKVMTDEEMENIARRNTIRMGGVINGNDSR